MPQPHDSVSRIVNIYITAENAPRKWIHSTVYDDHNRIIREISNPDSGSERVEYIFEWDARGNLMRRTLLTAEGEDEVRQYENSYDDQGHLTSVICRKGAEVLFTQRREPDRQGGWVETTMYANGDITVRWLTAQGKCSREQINSATQVQENTYDASENLTHSLMKSDEDSMDIHYRNVYDGQGRLLQVWVGDALQYEYVYDASGRVQAQIMTDPAGNREVHEYEYARP